MFPHLSMPLSDSCTEYYAHYVSMLVLIIVMSACACAYNMWADLEDEGVAQFVSISAS